MKVKLSAKDRFVIKEEVLPRENAPKVDILLTLEIIDIVDLHSNEFTELGVSRLPDGRFHFAKEKDDVVKEFELNKLQVDLLKRQVSKREQRGWSVFNASTLEKIEKW